MISIVIPCFNEEAVLPLLKERLTKACESWGEEWEVVCVDDGSTDRTWRQLQEFQEKDARWKALSFSRNFGHQTAVSAGLMHASGDAVFVLDADLQDPPEELHRFIEKWKEGFEVVYAIRRNRKESWPKRWAYAVFYRLLARVTEFKIPLDSGDFCLLDRKVVDVLNEMPERNRFVRGLRAWAGFHQVGLEYERHERGAGKTHYTFPKLLKLAKDGIFSFSAVPLRLASVFGFYISLFSMLGVIFTLLQRIFRAQFESIGLAPVPGFATIVIAILFLGGIQLIFLGVIGEYLFRIFEEVKGRPQWIIRESTGFPEENREA